MELTRRDAIAALAAAGVAGGGAYLATTDGDRGTDQNDDSETGDVRTAVVETTTALAPVLYPSEVDDASEFVRTYVTGRVEDDADHRAGMVDAVAVLDRYANDEYGSDFRDLSPEQGDRLLSDVDMDRVGPDPAGSDLEQVRFYLVNELLYALFSSTTGGELVGTENPPGHPGGLDSYQGAHR